MKKLAEKILQARIERYGDKRGSQVSLARAIGYDTSRTYQRWESGKAIPPINKLEEIAQDTGKTLAWFLCDNDERVMQQAIDEVLEEYGRDITIEFLCAATAPILKQKLAVLMQERTEDAHIKQWQSNKIEQLQAELEAERKKRKENQE